MTPRDLRSAAIDAILDHDWNEKRRFVRNGRTFFNEWLSEDPQRLWEFSPGTPIGKVLIALCGAWIEKTNEGADYLDDYTNHTRGAA